MNGYVAPQTKGSNTYTALFATVGLGTVPSPLERAKGQTMTHQHSEGVNGVYSNHGELRAFKGSMGYPSNTGIWGEPQIFTQ